MSTTSPNLDHLTWLNWTGNLRVFRMMMCSSSNCTVLRNDVISHTAADNVRRDAAQTWLPDQGVETLLTHAEAITSKYSLLYRASQYGGIACADDYKNTLEWLRKALSAHEAQIDQEIADAGLSIE